MRLRTQAGAIKSLTEDVETLKQQLEFQVRVHVHAHGDHVASDHATTRIPLHVHVPTERTSDYSYLPAVANFLDFAEEHKCPLTSPERVDRALADCLAWRCYHDELGLAHGKNMIFGVMTVFPEFDRGFPVARRALEGWKRVEDYTSQLCIHTFCFCGYVSSFQSKSDAVCKLLKKDK